MFFYLPNGIETPNWNPSYTGKLAELPRILKLLEPFHDDMLLPGNWSGGCGVHRPRQPQAGAAATALPAAAG
jgi:hypothetical protein